MSFATAATALPIGIAFGFVLERAGLGDSRVIAGQFTGRNFAVVRVMFGAIVTAMLGVMWLGAAGWINADAIAMPPTNIAAQTIGAIIFGGGFALASLCPGTACVAAASGKRAGVVAVVGLLLGTASTAFLWPVVDGVMNAGLHEGARLPEDFGVPTGAVVFTVTALAIVAMAVARRSKFDHTRAWYQPATLEWVALSLAASFWLTEAKPQQSPSRLAAIASEITNEADHVDPLELAEWIKNSKPGLRIIDVRDNVDSNTYVIPGARVLPLDSVPFMEVASNELVVLYSEGGAHAAQGWVLLRARGLKNVRVLKDGMAAWEDEVMSPAPPARSASTGTSAEIADSATVRFKHARALALWFGGHPRGSDESTQLAVPVSSTSRPISPPKPATRVRRRNTC